MRRFLLKVSVAAGLLSFFIIGYGAFCDYFFTQKRFLDLSEKKQWVLAQEGGNYDYAILGSSRAFGAFDMNLLDSLTGMRGINLGSNGSGFKDNYLVLKLFLNSNKVAKLFLQVDMGTLNSKSSFSNEFHAFTFLPYWSEPAVQEVLKEEIFLFDNELTSFLPQWRYFYFNKYFSPKEVIRKANLLSQQDNPYAISKGGNKGHSNQMDPQIKPVALPNSIDPTDWKYLLKVKELVESNQIELVFFSAPRYLDRQTGLNKVLSQFSNEFWNLSDFECDNASFFQDQGHLNQDGRLAFTNRFSHQLLQSL